MGGFSVADPGEVTLKGVGQIMQDRQFGQELALKQAQAESERQLQAAQTQQIQLQNTQLQRDQASQQAIQEAMRSNPAKIMRNDFSDLEGKVQPKDLINLQNMLLDHQTKLMGLSKEQAADRANALNEVATTIDGLNTLVGKNADGSEDLSRVNAELPQAIARLQKNGVWQRAGIQQAVPQNITTSKQLEDWAAGVGIEHEAQKAAIDRQKEQAETAAKQAEAAKTTLGTQIEQQQLDLYKQLKANPEALAQRVAGSIDPKKYPAEYDRAVNEARNASDLKGINEAITKHSQNISEQEKSIAVAGATRLPMEEQAALDREAKNFGAAHEKSLTAADAQLEKITDARNMIQGNAEAQALGIPKVLTALVSGQGSGVRITQPELNSIAKARGIVGDVQGWFNSITGAGKLSETQKQQLTGILDDVKAKIQQKRQIASDALDKINGAPNRAGIIAADKEARDKLGQLESAGAKPRSITLKNGNTLSIGDPITLKDGSKHHVLGFTAEGQIEHD